MLKPRGPHNPFVTHLPYDLFVQEPQLVTALEYPKFTTCLLKHHDSLLPSAMEQQSLTSLVSRICEVIEGVIVNPTGSLAGQIEEVRCVGSYKFGTWLADHNTADMVIVTRMLPTAEVLRSIQNYVETRLALSPPDVNEPCHVGMQFYGFSVTSGRSIVRLFVSTTPANLSKSNPEIHVNPVTQKAALAAVRQSRWFEENVSNTTIKVLIRIIKDFRRRFKAFQYLSSWLITLLCVHVVMHNPTCQPLPIDQAFRRFLQLLASGMLLPGSAGVVDPCEPGGVRLHSYIAVREQDEICCTAQTLLRALLHGSYEMLFNYDEYEDESNATFMRTVSSITWSQPVITSSDEQ